MKIIIATGVYPPEIGGPATFAALFEEGLAERHISYCTLPFRSVRTFPKIIRHIAYFGKLFFSIQRGDIVFALDPVSVGLPACLAARLRHARFYLRVGGDYAWEQGMQRFGVSELPDQFLERYAHAPRSFPFLLRFLIRIERWVARYAQKVLVQSSYLGSIVERWGIPKEKIVVVPNSVEVPELPSQEESRRTLQWDANRKIILSSGRLVPWKGFHVLMDAVRSVSETQPSVQLVIVGDGPQRKELEAYAATMRSPRFDIVFTGSVSRDVLMQMLRAADVFALNTGYEGFSHQILEACAVGTPVVTTDIPGNADALEHGKTGLMVPYNNAEALVQAISRLLTNTEYAQELSTAARMHVKQYTRAYTVAKTCAALDIDTALRVLMISGDANALQKTSTVHARLVLQAQQTGFLTVYVPATRSESCALAEQGVVQGFVGAKHVIARRMIWAAREMICDVVTAQDPFFLGWIAWRIAKHKRVPLQLQLHTNIFHPSFRQQSIAHWIKYQLARFLLSRADCIRVVSEALQQELLAAGVRAPITVLPIFINKEAIDSASPFSFTSYGFSHTLLIVSRLEPEKRVADVLYAFPNILKVFPHAGLVVAGDGSQKKQFQRLAAQLAIEKQAVFLGNRTDVFSLYKGADCFIATPARFEGYGATVVEALAAHCPTVSYDVGIAREAGAHIVPEGGVAAVVVSVLESGQRGTLRIPLPSAQTWAQEWKKGIEESR